MVELTMGIVLGTFLLGSVVVFMNSISTLSTNHSSVALTERRSRTALENVVRDLRSADCVLASYGAYKSDNRSTIVMRLPKKDGAGNYVDNEWEIVIYQLAGSTLPKSLKRITASQTTAGGTTPALHSTVPAAFDSISVDYVALTSLTGDGARKTFTLPAPYDNTSPDAPVVDVNGANIFADGYATFSGTTLSLNSAPGSGVPIDVAYPVDADTATAVSGANGASLVHLVIKPYRKQKNVNGEDCEKHSTVESRIVLRNRSF